MTVRYAHMKEAPKWKVGDSIKSNDIIGIMGSSGQSTGAHLHIDLVEENISASYTLADIGTKYTPNIVQLNYFIDEDLFKTKYKVTTYYCEPEYLRDYKKMHYGYDIIPSPNAAPVIPYIYWNRSKAGKVVHIEDSPKSYGHCIFVQF